MIKMLKCQNFKQVYNIQNIQQKRIKKYRKIMQNELNCPLCQDQYTDVNPPRLLVTCGHTFCQQCFKTIMQQKQQKFVVKCPEDGQILVLNENNVNGIPRNLALLKMIQTKKNNSSFKDPDFDMSKIAKIQDQDHEDQQDRQIMDVIVLSNSAVSNEKINLQKQQSKKSIKQDKITKQVTKIEQKCSVHKKPLQVVCIKDLKRICANCAIFGQHRGHEFKSIEEIEKQSSNYYSSILQIMQKKQKVYTSISNEQTCASIMQIIGNKKIKMKNNIADKFKKLVQSIENKQKQSVKQMEALFQKAQLKLKNLMKIDSKTLQKYDQWEQKSYEQIKILQGNDFQCKLQLLFSEHVDANDILEEGLKIIQIMNKQEDNMFNQVQIAIQNIGVQFNQEIYNYIDGFVQLFDEIKKKKPKSKLIKQENVQSSLIKNTNKIEVNSSIIKKQSQQQKPKQLVIPRMSLPSIRKQSGQIQQNLLQHQEKMTKRIQFVKNQQISMTESTNSFQQKTINSPLRREKDMVSPSNKFIKKNQMSEQLSPRALKSNPSKKEQQSFHVQKFQKPNKKKLQKLKLPQKIQKLMQQLINDQLQTFDITNAELGDTTVILLSQFLFGSKVKTVKLIRNKLSDSTILKILPYMKGVITLNLSQNFLTQTVLDILIQNRGQLQSVKSIILSQNKIVDRKAKPKLDAFKNMGITVSL